MLARLALRLTVAAVLFATSHIALAAGVVGSGTPESCTEATLYSALTGGGSVTFDCGAAPHTIVITSVKTILTNTSIYGGGTITLSGANSAPFFDIETDVPLLLDGITLTRGFGEHGTIINSGTLTINNSRIEKCNSAGEEGGAISNYGGLTITGTAFAENSSSGRGGAIFSFEGTVYVAGSTFTDNSTTGTMGIGAGGAIMAYLDAPTTVINSTFSGNTATYGGAVYATDNLILDGVIFDGNHCVYNALETPKGDGGAVYANSETDIVDSTFTGNEAPDGNGGAMFVNYSGVARISRTTFTENEPGTVGGAIANDGSTTVKESTFHANRGAGAAIFSGIYTYGDPPEVYLYNSTVSDNTSSSAGAIAATRGQITLAYVTVAGNIGSGGIVEGQLASFEFSNSVFADNTPSNCFLKPAGQSKGFNISSDDSCELIALNDDPSTDPLLGPLSDNGGPTLTRLPDPLSPAIDEAQCLPGFDIDQRGVVRPQGIACDRGAVERAPEDTTTTTTTTSTTSTTVTSTTTTTVASTTTTTVASTTTTTVASGGACGDPAAFVISRSGGVSANAVTASDALQVLKAAVGLSSCELCVCDVDGSGSITATDALATLRAAVGLPVDLNCPVCD